LARAALACAVFLAAGACARPRPVVKIALVAPFEGRLREVGYQAFPALRLAVREQLAAGGAAGYDVSFVAYNDDGDPAVAARVARNVALDASVMGVIGHYRPDTTLAALGVYTAAGLALIAPGVSRDALPEAALVFRMGPPLAGGAPVPAGTAGCREDDGLVEQALRLAPDLQAESLARLFGSRLAGMCFVTDAPHPEDLPAAGLALAGYTAVSGGPEPGPRSLSAYDAARVLLEAIRLDADRHGAPTRAGVAAALREASLAGLLGDIAFDARGVWKAAPMWLYRFDAGGWPRVAAVRAE
jgi:ABC-type branched-subunit amino acid transport system substrate-binding protein